MVMELDNWLMLAHRLKGQMRRLLEFSWSPWKSTWDTSKSKTYKWSCAFIYHNETMPIHWVLCLYIVENRLLSKAKKQQDPLLIDCFIFSSPLKECRLEKAGSSEHQLPPLQAACDVTWAVWSPWEKTLMHTGNNQGNTGRVQRNANIFRVLKKQYHTHTHTPLPNATP